MKIIRASLLIVLIFILASCNASSTNHPSNSPSETLVKPLEVSSPFTQFESIKRGEMGINGEHVDNILRSYGIYDKILVKITKSIYNDSSYCDVKMNGFDIGNKKVAVLLIDKGHLYIYVMFSNSGDRWVVDGFAYQNERGKPEYRVEQSSDGTRYWLVVKHEANHGTGLYVYDEIWYNPDGSFAAEYPLEGSTLFFPQIIEPAANTYFSTSAHYDGDSAISLSYSVSFMYSYKNSFQKPGYVYKFQSEYRPVTREYWEYDLKAQQFKFVSCDPTLPEGFSTMKHVVSADYGILQGYIDFYRTRLGDKKITTLAEWERFMDLND